MSLNSLEVNLGEAKLNFLIGLWILFRLKFKLYVVKFILAHQGG